MDRPTFDLERADRLTSLIEDQGWDIADLARVVGASPSNVYRWIKGETISSRNIGALARALGSTRDYIASGTGPRRVEHGDVLGALAETERNVIDRLDRLDRDLGPAEGDVDLPRRKIGVPGPRAPGKAQSQPDERTAEGED